MLLIILFNTIIQEFKNSKIIINLTFIFQSVHNWLIYCQKMIKLDKIFDYKFMKTVFYLQTSKWEISKHRTWKKMNKKTIKKKNKIIWISYYFDFTTNIKQYTEYFLKFTNDLMNEIIFWMKNEKKSVL